jgi:Spy/CpxP family protein refolding chaperone
MKRIILTALLLSTFGIVALPAQAQPVHGGTPLEMLARLKPQLNLNTSQQQQWDSAVAQSSAAHDAARASFAQVKAAVQTELAKAEPDFVAIAAVTDNASQQNATVHKQVRDAWLALYATFSPEQKVIARDAIKSGIERMQARRAAHERTPRAN